MMWRCLFIMGCIIGLIPCRAALQTVDNALSAVVKASLPSAQYSTAVLQARQLSLPIVEKVEMRTEIDRLLLTRQEYLARVSFNGLGQRKAEQEKLRAYTIWKEAGRDASWQPSLLQMYRNLVDWHLQVLTLSALREEITLVAKEDSLSALLLKSGKEIDLVDYYALQKERQWLRTEWDNAYTRWKTLAKTVGADTLTVAADVLWIKPDKMLTLLDSIRPVTLKEPMAELEYLSASSRAVLSESRRWLDFLQTRYTVRDDLLLQNRFSIGLGLLVPWRGSARLKEGEIAFRRQQLEEDLRTRSVLQAREVIALKQDVTAAVVAWQKWQNIVLDTSLSVLRQKIEQSGRVDVIKWLRLQRDDVRRRSAEIREQKKIWETYIELLHVTGVMYTRPLNNYLYGLRSPVLLR